ncbi:MAG: hypothetical protein K0R62_2154 [Nonomuraea muscovyensis]|jgi:hypothetical protein|uniref:Uncharacterized protein n=1 Tax=Nonomuraea muscovyensis TaxID=1124761 RepID=A0A7X0EZE9_9ACTN|nr:hypothetical protein [Nonomuraea muscovyensis]MDF2706502.1 hypothetical protein [Nonomuraea muscovyensis]
MRILNTKKHASTSVSYLKVLAEQAREQRIRYQKPRSA